MKIQGRVNQRADLLEDLINHPQRHLNSLFFRFLSTIPDIVQDTNHSNQPPSCFEGATSAEGSTSRDKLKFPKPPLNPVHFADSVGYARFKGLVDTELEEILLLSPVDPNLPISVKMKRSFDNPPDSTKSLSSSIE